MDAKHMPLSAMLVKNNNGNELLVSAAFVWDHGDKNGLPQNSSVDAAEPLNQFRLLFHIYYSYFFPEYLCLIKEHYIGLFLRFMTRWCTSLRGR